MSHSTYSASAFRAAMQCPGKTVMEQGLPDTSSAAAREGTLAHEWFEQCMLGLDMAACPDDMLSFVEQAVADTWSIIGPGPVLLEQRLDYADSIGAPAGTAYGTADVVALRGDVLHVIDFKYGRGVEVSAAENPQMLLYALGALESMDALGETCAIVRMSIIQPRVAAHAGCLREWAQPVTAVRAWGRTVAARSVAAREAARDGAGADPVRWREHYLQAGTDACRWCRAQATCPAARDYVTQVTHAATASTIAEFDDLGDPAPVDTSDGPEWLAASLGKLASIRQWADAVETEALRRALAGIDVPGYKLVAGRPGNRAWVSPGAAADALIEWGVNVDDVFVQTVVSPAAAEKLTKKNKNVNLEPLVTRKPGAPTLAGASDPRPALMQVSADDFQNLTKETK